MSCDLRLDGSGSMRLRLALHGPAVEIDCAVPAIHRQIERSFGPFAVAELPGGFSATVGQIRPYDHEEVMRHLSPTAQRIPTYSQTDELVEIYQEDERFWLIDDRWGMSEINLLRGQWRSWLLPDPRMDPYRCMELAVLWPLAQLLRSKGIHLLPAASVVCDGWAALLVCPFSLEPELRTLIQSGYRVIGQRWTTLREEEGRLALLHLPGRVERPWTPRLATASGDDEASASHTFNVGGNRTDPSASSKGPSATAGAGSIASSAGDLPGWTDLMAEYRGAWQNHAFCDAVVVMGSGRRSQPGMLEADAATAANLLRRAWPLPELHPSRRQGQLPLRLARQCACAQAHLSRDPRDLLAILHSLRASTLKTNAVRPIDDIDLAA